MLASTRHAGRNTDTNPIHITAAYFSRHSAAAYVPPTPAPTIQAEVCSSVALKSLCVVAEQDGRYESDQSTSMSRKRRRIPDDHRAASCSAVLDRSNTAPSAKYANTNRSGPPVDASATARRHPGISQKDDVVEDIGPHPNHTILSWEDGWIRWEARSADHPNAASTDQPAQWVRYQSGIEAKLEEAYQAWEPGYLFIPGSTSIMLSVQDESGANIPARKVTFDPFWKEEQIPVGRGPADLGPTVAIRRIGPERLGFWARMRSHIVINMMCWPILDALTLDFECFPLYIINWLCLLVGFLLGTVSVRLPLWLMMKLYSFSAILVYLVLAFAVISNPWRWFWGFTVLDGDRVFSNRILNSIVFLVVRRTFGNEWASFLLLFSSSAWHFVRGECDYRDVEWILKQSDYTLLDEDGRNKHFKNVVRISACLLRLGMGIGMFYTDFRVFGYGWQELLKASGCIAAIRYGFEMILNIVSATMMKLGDAMITAGRSMMSEEERRRVFNE